MTLSPSSRPTTHHPSPITPVPPAVAMRDISKRFGSVVANDHVDFEALWGEVHALIGENGAGKSTLMSILAGLYRPDSGQVEIDGTPVRLRSPRDAIAQGIGMVYQHFMLVEPFTVAENVVLGEQRSGVGLQTARVERELAALSERYGLGVDPRARIWQLSVGEQQRVEILRLLYLGARILVFDEPTAVLTPQEAQSLLQTLRGMASQGFSVVFISHKLDEVLEVADRVSVLRRGQIVATTPPAETDRRTLARLMVGRELADFVEHPADEPHEAVTTGEPVLELRGVGALGDKGVPALRNVDLEVSAGETLGIAGVAGNGQRELAEVVTGSEASDRRGHPNRRQDDDQPASGGDRPRGCRAYPRGPPGNRADRGHGSLRKRHPARLCDSHRCAAVHSSRTRRSRPLLIASSPITT